MTVVVAVTVFIASVLMLLAIREANIEDRFNQVSRGGDHRSQVHGRHRRY